MTLSYAPYTLAPGRKGAILRIQEGECCGYADLHPIPSWGDPSLEALLKLQTGPLWERTLYFAHLDLQARKKKVSLFEGKVIPKSHHLMINASSIPPASRGEVIKLKVGNDLTMEKAALRQIKETGIEVKLDCGFRFERKEFLAQLPELLPKGLKPLYIEDPYPFQREHWIEDQKELGILFAFDQGSEAGIGDYEAAPILVLKPARQAELPFYRAIDSGQRVVVTSCIDHPLGQAAAAWVATFFPDELSGLLSHEVLPTNPYAALIKKQGRAFAPPKGFGFGFDPILENERFTCLN